MSHTGRPRPLTRYYRDELIAYNRWLCDTAAPHAESVPFVTANPAVMTSRDLAPT